MTRTFTGWHAASIISAGFAVIIAVNLTLAMKAVQTFPGLEVRNSYVASQSFDADRAAQLALGWTVTAEVANGDLHLRIDDAEGRPVLAEITRATLGRATHVGDDATPDFTHDGRSFVAPVALTPGYWNLRLEAVAPDGTVFRQRIQLRVK